MKGQKGIGKLARGAARGDEIEGRGDRLVIAAGSSILGMFMSEGTGKMTRASINGCSAGGEQHNRAAEDSSRKSPGCRRCCNGHALRLGFDGLGCQNNGVST